MPFWKLSLERSSIYGGLSVGGGLLGKDRAFAEWQRETSLPESDLQYMGWARVKCVLRVLACLSAKAPLIWPERRSLGLALEPQ